MQQTQLAWQLHCRAIVWAFTTRDWKFLSKPSGAPLPRGSSRRKLLRNWGGEVESEVECYHSTPLFPNRACDFHRTRLLKVLSYLSEADF